MSASQIKSQLKRINHKILNPKNSWQMFFNSIYLSKWTISRQNNFRMDEMILSNQLNYYRILYTIWFLVLFFQTSTSQRRKAIGSGCLSWRRALFCFAHEFSLHWHSMLSNLSVFFSHHFGYIYIDRSTIKFEWIKMLPLLDGFDSFFSGFAKSEKIILFAVVSLENKIYFQQMHLRDLCTSECCKVITCFCTMFGRSHTLCLSVKQWSK